MSYTSATVVSQTLIHYDILARQAVQTNTVQEFLSGNGEEIVSLVDLL